MNILRRLLGRSNGDPSTGNLFARYFRNNQWGGDESRSGTGSSLDQTAVLRRELPALLQRLGALSILDIPCGDFHWMSKVDLGVTTYFGGDLVPEVVEHNRARFAERGRQFLVLDLTRSKLPKVDLIFCRDCLVHLSFADVGQAIRRFRESGSTYLCTTTFTALAANSDIPTGEWRPLNFSLSPFSFPPPLEVINEECTEDEGRYSDKSVGLWRIADLPSL